jgi:uncharacterized protein YjbI with pentapeptide repeats
MAEGKGTPAPKQEKEPDKRPSWWKRLWEWTEFGKKSGWNWLELLSALAIPVVLAVAGLYFEAQLDARQRSIENQRAQAERELAKQRAQDEALQAYLDQMGSLLLEEDLRNSEKGSEVRTLARARTVTVIQRLDSDRNGNVIRFLDEAGLIGKEESSIRLLAGADLRGAQLQGIVLYGADLNRAFLINADLSQADLSGADLSKAILSDANLSHAGLGGTNLSGASLAETNLSLADLSNADLRGAHLDYADLSGATLDGANLSGAYLYRADLSGADLSITNEKLEQQAFSLEGATMPDGQKYEEWLKSKGSGEENSGPS